MEAVTLTKKPEGSGYEIDTAYDYACVELPTGSMPLTCEPNSSQVPQSGSVVRPSDHCT